MKQMILRKIGECGAVSLNQPVNFSELDQADGRINIEFTANIAAVRINRELTDE